MTVHIALGGLVIALATAGVHRWLARAAALVRRSVLVVGTVAMLSVVVADWVLPAGWLEWSPTITGNLEGYVTERVGAAVGVAAATAANPFALSPKPVTSTSLPASESWWLTAVWWLGLSLATIRIAAAEWRAHRLKRRAAPLDSRSFPVLRESHTAVEIPLRISPEISTPAVVGWRHPCILLPKSAETWDPQTLRAAWLHEWAHIAHRDPSLQRVATWMCAVHWFNPLAWWIAHRLRHESEVAADDRVLRSGMRPSTYAKTLVALARDRLTPASTAIALVSSPSGLTRRVESIVAPQTRRRGPTGTWVSAVAGSYGALVLLLTATRPASATPRPDLVTHATTDVEAPAVAAGLRDAVDQEIERLVDRWHPTGAAVVVLDPQTRRVLASGDYRGALARSFEPASTIKPFTFATAIEAGLDPDTRVDGEGGEWIYDAAVFRDHHAFGSMTLTQSLAQSSNVGALKVFAQAGPRALRTTFVRLGLPAPPRWTPAQAAGAALGHGLQVTPVQLARAYASLATVSPTNDAAFRPSTVLHVRQLMEAVVHSPEGTGRQAQVRGIRVAGKTGTSPLPRPGGGFFDDRTQATFVGLAPATHPRFVVLVTVTDPRSGASGGVVAAPAFARIAAAALDSLDPS
ncbi:MAG: hypothetical protein B7733_07265 [Myxococcales bacterium FL481]|nr:MAG: hypothetical protein B7733_07265 [Myxococcales bacterium FL481]